LLKYIYVAGEEIAPFSYRLFDFAVWNIFEPCEIKGVVVPTARKMYYSIGALAD
jgi:hypothetical protein